MRNEPQSWTLSFRDAALERDYRAAAARAGIRWHRVLWSFAAIDMVLLGWSRTGSPARFS